MATPERYVSDTKVLVSFLPFYGSVPVRPPPRAWRTAVLLRCDSTLPELVRVLERPKCYRYLTRYERAIFLQRFIQDTVPANAPPAIPASRDTRDDGFLELTIAGQPTCIITGDSDCSTHPFRGIPIVTPGQFIGPAAGA